MLRNGNTGIVLSEMPRMGAMEELVNAVCGRLCWRLEDSTTIVGEESRSGSAGRWTWQKLSSGLADAVVLGLDDTLTQEDLADVCFAGISSTGKEFSLIGCVSTGCRSRPSPFSLNSTWRFFWGRNGRSCSRLTVLQDALTEVTKIFQP